MIPTQCRAARALLGISQRDLAVKSAVSVRAVAGLELNERAPKGSTLWKLEKALVKSGIRFIHELELVGVLLDTSQQPQRELRRLQQAPKPHLVIRVKLDWISPAQCRAARALIGLSQAKLAELSGASKRTIAGFELDSTTLQPPTLRKLETTFDRAGIRFLREPDGIGVAIASATN